MPQAVRLLCPWDRYVDAESAWISANSIQQEIFHILKTNWDGAGSRVAENNFVR